MRWKFETWFKSLICIFTTLLLWSIWASGQSNTNTATVEFSRSDFMVKENSRSESVSLRRTGNTNAAVTVDFATVDGTAVAGLDYRAKAGPVTFAAGQSEAEVTVPILDNFKMDGNRKLLLRLSNPSEGAALGQPSRADLEILDNDTKQTAWLTFGLNRVEFLQRELFEIPLWQYVASLLYIFLAFFVSKLFDFLIRGRVKHWAVKTKTQFDDVLLELCRGPIKIVVFVILLHLGLRIFSWPEWFADFLSHGLKIVAAVSIAYMLVKAVDLVTTYWTKRSREDDDEFNKQLLPIIRKTLKVFVVVVVALVTLQNLGLNITSLITSLGIGGLALALAAQDTLANLFGAIAVLVDKPFKVGDRIQLDSVDGVVESIGLRSTRVRNQDGHLVAIPNKTVGNATVTNIAQRPNIRTLMNIGITYDTPTEKVKLALQILEEVFRGHPKTLDVWISFNKFADSALNIHVIHWWNGRDPKEFLDGMQELNFKIKERFDQEGIEFAFPTQTVYLKQGDRLLGTEGTAGAGPT